MATIQSRQSAKLFLQSSELGVCPPPLFSGGGAHSLAGEGVGESQFRREDIQHTVVLYIFMYFVGCKFDTCCMTISFHAELKVVHIPKVTAYVVLSAVETFIYMNSNALI